MLPRLGQLVQTRPLLLQLLSDRLSLGMHVRLDRLPQQQLEQRDRSLGAQLQLTVDDVQVRHLHLGEHQNVPLRGIRVTRNPQQVRQNVRGNVIPRSRSLQQRGRLLPRLDRIEFLESRQRLIESTSLVPQHRRVQHRVVQLLHGTERRPARGSQHEGLSLRRRLIHQDLMLLRGPLHRVGRNDATRIGAGRVTRVPRLEPLQHPLELLVDPEELVRDVLAGERPQLITSHVQEVRQQHLTRIRITDLQSLLQSFDHIVQHLVGDRIEVPTTHLLDEVGPNRCRLRRNRGITGREPVRQDRQLCLLVSTSSNVHGRPALLIRRRTQQRPPHPQIHERICRQMHLGLVDDLVTVIVPANRLEHRRGHHQHEVRLRPRQLLVHQRNHQRVGASLVLGVTDEQDGGSTHQEHLCGGRTLSVQRTLPERASQNLVHALHSLAELLAVSILASLVRLLLEIRHQPEQYLALVDHRAQVRDLLRRTLAAIHPLQERDLLPHPLQVILQDLRHLSERPQNLVPCHLRIIRGGDHERPVRPRTCLLRLCSRNLESSIAHLLDTHRANRILGGLLLVQLHHCGAECLRLARIKIRPRLLRGRRKLVELLPAQHILRLHVIRLADRIPSG